MENPNVHIDRLLEYPEATHHIEYFNTRRAEMLPPNFKEADKGEFFNLHEIDNPAAQSLPTLSNNKK